MKKTGRNLGLDKSWRINRWGQLLLSIVKKDWKVLRMTQIKIKSNPYNREISYQTLDGETGNWIDIKRSDERSRLRERESERSFLPFKIKEILSIIVKEYYVGREKVQLIFEGTQDEYVEIASVCESDEFKEKIDLMRSNTILKNARFIKEKIKETFETVNPVVKQIMQDDEEVKKEIDKVSKALDDVIPLCVFGNYSAGKSTFINALTGVEILPSGSDPVTAKIYEIKKSKHPDQAEITFEFHNERIKLTIEGKELIVSEGNPGLEIVKSIKEEIANDGTYELYAMVRIAMEILNNYEKRDREVTEISNVISLSVPFSPNGVIGTSQNKFVIFDTPGSNSNSNEDHSKVLDEAMDGFSNGIPLWITQYDAHDTKDNAELCDNVLAIKSLDKRFTMIIFNKADDADLPEDGFTEKQVNEILEYRAIEKMYANGIFFVSSIIGLGGKNNGEFVDRFYGKKFRTQSLTFSDPEDIDYLSLYKYNIMPSQVKQNALEYSQKNENLIYSNSGLYCVEKEIETFASKHSAYNKCHMAVSFLRNVIGKTNARIDEKKKTREEIRDHFEQQLDAAAQLLKQEIDKSAKTMEEDYGVASKSVVEEYVNQILQYPMDEEELAKVDANIRKEIFEHYDYESTERALQEAKNKRREHWQDNFQGLFKRNILDAAKTLVNDVASDVKNVQESKNKKNEKEKSLDHMASTETINYVIESYKNNIDDAQKKLSIYLDEFWSEKERDFKKQLILKVTESDTLTDSQREEIASKIQNYDINNFKEQANLVFVREKFLKGTLLGIHIIDDEKLNTSRLARIYNDKIKASVKEMSQMMNEDCFMQFKNWERKILDEINAGLTEFNPGLKELVNKIRIETESLIELEQNQTLIRYSLETMKSLMSWEVVEGV